MIKKLNVAVIGLGVGNRHADIYKKNKYCNLKIVCDFDKKKLNLFSKKNKNILTVTNDDIIFDNNLIDLVSIASYDKYHYEQILKCFKSKKHFFIEKPICKNEKELRKIKNLYIKNKKNIKFSSNFVLRGNHYLNKMKKELFNIKNEKIFYIEGDYNYGRLNKITNGWRSMESNYSINLGGAIHIIDLFSWFTKSNIASVIATANKIVTNKSNFKYNDFSSSLIKFKDGSIGKINANFGAVIPHNHFLKIFTNKRTIEYSFNELFFYNSRNKNTKPKKYTKNTYKRDFVLNSFILHLIMNSKPEVTPEDIFKNMSIAFSIDKSIANNRWTKVNYI